MFSTIPIDIYDTLTFSACMMLNIILIFVRCYLMSFSCFVHVNGHVRCIESGDLAFLIIGS